MALLLHSCAGRVSYATEIRAVSAAHARHGTYAWCGDCGRFHVRPLPRRARAWAAIRKAFDR
jgi:hypothetical protein